MAVDLTVFEPRHRQYLQRVRKSFARPQAMPTLGARFHGVALVLLP